MIYSVHHCSRLNKSDVSIWNGRNIQCAFNKKQQPTDQSEINPKESFRILKQIIQFCDLVMHIYLSYDGFLYYSGNYGPATPRNYKKSNKNIQQWRQYSS